MLNPDPRTFLHRTVAFVSGVSLLALGIGPVILRHDLFYKNWFGGLVFAPVAIIAGVWIIFGALFKPEVLEKPKKRTKH